MKKILLLIFFGIGLFLINANIVYAGFGIAPPYVNNENLLRGSHYEKEILLIRGEALDALNAEIAINVLGAEGWISIDRGNNFILPVGEKQIPIVVKVDVPQEAAFGNYKGNIRIKTSPINPEKGTVTIALGAQIDVDLEVIKGGVSDFKIRAVGLNDTEEERIIEMWMSLENVGGEKTSPSKVTLDIYSQGSKNLLASLIDNNITDKVPPFQTQKILAKFNHQLTTGSYSAYFKIFNGGKVVKEGELTLSILPKGSLPPLAAGLSSSFSFMGNKTIWFFLLALVVLIIIIALVFFIKKIKGRKK